jgi:uncharacterized damage-inducible protein DinB
MRLYDVAPAEGYHPEIGLLIATLEDSQREWSQNLGRVSPLAVTWQPHAEGPSIGAVLLHMADCEAFWFEQFLGGKQPDAKEEQLLMVRETDLDNGKWPTPPTKPLAWYRALHRKVTTRARESLRGLDPEHVVRGRRNEFTVRWVVAHVAEHDAYHGGQLVMLHELWKRTAR